MRFSGVAAVAVLWTTIGLGLLLAGLSPGGDRPISYLDGEPRGMVLFRSGLLVATVLLVAFALAVHRRLARPTGFLALFLFGMAGQALVATVPITGGGAQHAVHTAAGLALGLSLPLFIWRFAAAQPPGRWRALSYGLTWLEVAACVAGVVLSRASLAIIAEVVPAAGFHLWIIVVTLGRRSG